MCTCMCHSVRGGGDQIEIHRLAIIRIRNVLGLHHLMSIVMYHVEVC